MDDPGLHRLNMATVFVSSSSECSEVLTPILGDAAHELQPVIHPDVAVTGADQSYLSGYCSCSIDDHTRQRIDDTWLKIIQIQPID